LRKKKMTTQSKALKASDLPVKAVTPPTVVKSNNSLDYGSLEDAFPNVPAGLKPYGDKVLVQIRTAMTRTKSGFFLPEDSRESEKWNTQVAKVISLGPVAFKNRDTLEPWLEGAWCVPGTYVRCPKYGGDRWEVPVPGADPALFVIFRDVDLVGEIEGDPLAMVAYITA
jgi:co-chaperonin GroES (HSP10)